MQRYSLPNEMPNVNTLLNCFIPLAKSNVCNTKAFDTFLYFNATRDKIVKRLYMHVIQKATIKNQDNDLFKHPPPTSW